MFHRIALVPIGMLEQPTGSKLVFASEGEERNVSFDYRPEDNVYFRCRAISADVTNGNGDLFTEEELIKSFKSFIGVGLYKDHDSGSVDKAIGKVLWAEWIPDGKYVECYCAVDKKLAPELAHRVKSGIIDSVSMGCSVQEAECSVCGNVAHNINELCDHMRPGSGVKGRRNAKGEIIAEINRGIQFNELSLVTVPADSTARVFEIYAALNKKAAEEKEKKTSKDVDPLLKDAEFAYSNIYTKEDEADHEKTRELVRRFEAESKDPSDPEFVRAKANLEMWDEIAQAKELAGNYIRLSTPLHILMYDQYNKMKDEGVPDEENVFANAARLREEFTNQLQDAAEASNHGRNPENLGAYGRFLRWLMHSNLPDGLFGYHLDDRFRDGTDRNATPLEAKDSVMFRKNFVDKQHNGPFPGMVLESDVPHLDEIKRAFRDSVIKHIPKRQSTRKKENIVAYINEYFKAADTIQQMLVKYGNPDSMPPDVERKFDDLATRMYGIKSLLRGEHADSSSSKSIWDVLLEKNQDYLSLRKDRPEVRTFLRVEEPPKEAPQGLENLVGRDDAIAQYLQLQNSPLQKAIDRHKAKGRPLSKESLMQQMIQDNGIDEEQHEKILKMQGFDEKYLKVPDKFKDMVLEHYEKNKPFTRGMQVYLDKLLTSEPIQIAPGAPMPAANESEGVQPMADPWANNYPTFKSDEDRRADQIAREEKKFENSLKKNDPAYKLKKDLYKMMDGLMLGSAFALNRQVSADLLKVKPEAWTAAHFKILREVIKDLPNRLQKIDKLIAKILEKDPDQKNFKEQQVRDYLEIKKNAIVRVVADARATEHGQKAEKSFIDSEAKDPELSDKVNVTGVTEPVNYSEFSQVAEALAKKILGVKPLFMHGRIPADMEIDWPALMENIDKFDRLIGSAPETWKRSLFLERYVVLAASRFAARWRHQAGTRGEETRKEELKDKNVAAISQAAAELRPYLSITQEDLERLPEDKKRFVSDKFSEYAGNRKKIDEVVSSYHAHVPIGGAEARAIEYYIALQELGEHLLSIGFNTGDTAQADALAERQRDVAKDPVKQYYSPGEREPSYSVDIDGKTMIFPTEKGFQHEFRSREQAEEQLHGGKSKAEEEKKKEKESQQPQKPEEKLGPNSGSVARLHNKSEALNMGLKISFTKGKDLKASYFVANDGSSMYRVAASDVLPLVVQQAINANDPDVTTPRELVEDLQAKYASLHDFKRWAKRRRSKNKKAAEKYSKPEVSMQADSKLNAVESTGRNNEMPKSEGLEKAAAEEKEVAVTPVTETAPVVEATTEAATAAAPAAAATAVETPSEVKEIKAAFEVLLKFVEARLDKKAVLTENPEPKIDGKGKSSTAPMPSGIKEVSKTESPKGHVSASLKVEAMDENWSVNEKELEAEPKKAKPAQSMPMLMSVDSKEVASEQMTAKVDNKAAATVKKYYNQLGSGATGEPAKAIDAKSSQNSEVMQLRAALAQEKAEKEALIAKANLNAVADKIYNVVASLRAKNLLPKGKEEAMVDTLTQKFASVEALEGLNTVLETISPAAESATEDAPAPKVVPQTILESAQPQELDAAELLRQNWNK